MNNVKTALIGFSLMIFAVVSNNWAPSPLLPQIRETFNVSAIFVGLIVSVYSLSYGFLTLPKGMLSDKLGRKEVILPSLLVYSLFSILTGFAWSFPSLILFRLIDGIAAAALPAISFAYMADIVPSEKMGRIYGVLMAVFSASAVFGVLMSGIVAEHYTWRIPFIIFGVIGIISFLVLWNIPESKNHSNSGLHFTRGILGVAFAYFVIGLIAIGIYTYLGIFFKDRYGLSADISGVVMGLAGMAAILGGITGGILADKIGRIRCVALGYAIFTLGTLLFGLSVDFSVFILFLVVFLFGYMLPFPSLTAIAMTSTQQRGSVMGMNNFLFFAGGGLGALFSGYLYELLGFNGMAAVFGIAAILSCIFTLLLIGGEDDA